MTLDTTLQRPASSYLDARALRLAAAAILSMATATACSSSSEPPADLRGDYVGNVVNGSSTCPGNWTAQQSSQVSVSVTQTGSAASLTVTGAGAVALQLLLGATVFNGTVVGNSIAATLVGRTTTLGMCVYSYKATFDGQLQGNTLTGTVTYAPQTNGSPDCSAAQLQGCTSKQSFDATRPAM